MSKLTDDQIKIEVYSTSISDHIQANRLKAKIVQVFPELLVSFDLEDCDKILRIKYIDQLDGDGIEAISDELGIEIAVLPD